MTKIIPSWAQAMFNKKKNQRRLEFLKTEREMVRKAMDEAAISTPVTDGVNVIDAQEVADIVKAISPSGFQYRVSLAGAEGIYNSIGERNYKKLVKGIGHLETEDEFIAGMCLIDKCEEYGDYDSMAEVFKVFEYVVRHKKASSEVISYARKYVIDMRKYLTDLNLL